MRIEFDPDKDAAKVEKLGVSLSLAEEMDLAAAAVRIDDRYDYDETRYRAFGRIEVERFCLVFTIRPGIIRVISLRRAHERELERHGL